MKALNALFFVLADEKSFLDIKKFLAERYVLTELPPSPYSRAFYDSFDWRLYRSNFLCFVEKDQLHCRDFTGESQGQPLACPEMLARSSKDFPESPLRQVISPILENRALLLQGEFSGTRTPLHIMNAHGEIFACIDLLQAEPNVFCLEVQAVHRRKKAWRKLIRSLEDFAPAQAFPVKQQLDLILAAQGRQAQELSSSPALALQADMDSRTAFQQICRPLLNIMQQNQQGVIDDVDIEFLHDFRVALRRTRSALSLFKGLLEPGLQQHFVEAFRDLGRSSGPLRDLDVQLWAAEEQRSLLPERLHTGFASLLGTLETQRNQAQQAMALRLKSSEHETLFKAWQDFLDQQDSEDDPKALGPVAQKILQRRFMRIWRDCQALQADSSDQHLHQLRIQGKKFRYALEFFRPLYPEAEIYALISLLKNMQKHLGNYNDLVVQETQLEQALDSSDQIEAAATLGGLLTSFHDKRRHLRTETQETVELFIKEIRRYRRLFKA
jgi:CHAD domain-containing protein